MDSNSSRRNPMDSNSSRRTGTSPLCDLLGIGGDDDDREEGEYVPGDDYYHIHSSSDTVHHNPGRFDRSSSRREADDDDAVNPQQGGGRMRRLEDIVAVGARRVGAGSGAPLPASPITPAASSESDEGTISDDDRGARPAHKFACHDCGKGFSSRKAVDGHMRVHSSGGGSGGRQVVPAAPAPAPAPFSGGWAATGRRGCTGGKPRASVAAAASLNSEATTCHSTAIVPAVQVQPLAPVPLAFAATTNLSPLPSSTRTNLSGEDEGSSGSATGAAVATAAVVTGANPSSTGGVAVARAAGPVDHQLAVADQQAPAPQVHCQVVSVPPPAAQFAQQQPLVPPPPPPAAAAAAAAQLQQGGQLVPGPALPPREYSCKVCGKTYSTHQGLGGHAAGHKNREREQEAAMAAAAGMMTMMPNGGVGGAEFLAAFRRGARKAEAPHECQKCHKVFATGVALGGHMRMHYTGPPIVHKNKKKGVALAAEVQPPAPPAVTEADLRLALSAAIADLPSSSTAPPPSVAATGRLRLFGFDIAPLGEQAPSEQQGSGSGTTEEGTSSAGEKQHKQ